MQLAHYAPPPRSPWHVHLSTCMLALAYPACGLWPILHVGFDPSCMCALTRPACVFWTILHVGFAPSCWCLIPQMPPLNQADPVHAYQCCHTILLL